MLDTDTTFSDALGGLLKTQFERVYLIHEPYFEETTHGTQQSKTLQAMDSIRSICLGHLSALHSEFRLRLSAGVRINRLPQDVLIHIFSMLPLHEVVKTTHVCHYWRTVGRNTAALWTDISLSGAAFTSVSQLLALSKAAPVDLRLFRSAMSQPALVTAMLSLNHHMGHLRSLAVVPHSRKPRASRVPGNPPEWTVYAAPRLRSLVIWWPEYGDHRLSISVAPETGHSDFASLVHLDLRGNLQYNDFLPICKSLDTLRLDIPVDLSMFRLLSVIYANAALRRLELHFPKVSEVPDIASHPWADVTEDALPDVPVSNTIVICDIVSGDLDGWDSNVDFRLRHEQMLFRAFATKDIRLLTITCSPRTLDVAESLLRDMSTLRHMELRPEEVKVEDDRGFIRIFLRDGTFPTGVLAHSMDHIYTLSLSIPEWTSYNRGDFGCLEELQLDGTVRQCCSMRRAVGFPSLRRVTFSLSRFGPYDWAIEDDSSPEYDEDALVAIALALTVGRLDAWPRPLQQLTITGNCIARDFIFDTRHTNLVSQIQLTTRPGPSRFDGAIKTLREACSSITR